MVARRVDGMSRRQPYTTRSSSTLRLSFTLQNTLSWSDSDDFWFGNPLRIVPLRAWYTASSLACLQSSCKCKFSRVNAEARSSAIDSACVVVTTPSLVSISYSARSSPRLGGWYGWWERASAASFLDPFSHCAVKLYPIRRVLRHCSLGFSISLRRWMFKIGIRGLWSVMTVKCSIPARKMLHLLMAHATARHLSSITVYLLSASIRNRDPACTVLHSLVPLVDFCRSTNPISKVLASVWRQVSLVVLKYTKVGKEVNTFLGLCGGFILGFAP